MHRAGRRRPGGHEAAGEEGAQQPDGVVPGLPGPEAGQEPPEAHGQVPHLKAKETKGKTKKQL